MSRRRYRSISSGTLRARLWVLTKFSFCGLFAREAGEIELELTLRDLDAIANDSGGYLVAWIVGEQ